MEKKQKMAGSTPRASGWRACGKGLALALVLMAPGVAMAQNVLWEDYRGEDNVASDDDYIGTPDAPKFQNYPNSGAMAPFRTLTSNPADAARTGSSTNIDFSGTSANDSSLCNNGALGSQACLHQAQGRVLYSLISFPQAGTYTLSAAHDDNLVVELSTDYANISYRNASYDIPVGQLSEWTSNENTFATIGTFNAANADSCALIRVFWTNQGGINHNRLQWTLPDGTTQIVPATAFRNPSLAASATGCNGSITGNGTAITLNKVLGSPRLAASDQFTIEIGTSQGGGTVRSATTSGTGTGQQASTGAFPASTGTTYYLREVMASGSTSALVAYDASIDCTRNGTSFTPTVVDAALRRWSVVAQANDQVVCAITNTAPMADLSIAKTGNASPVVSGDPATYTIVARNDGPQPADGAIVRDDLAGATGLDCTTPASTLICATTPAGGCPAGPLTPQDLQSGIAITPFPVDGTVTFTLTCTVSATGLP